MLIKCPECKKEISDRAEICVGCGFPIRDYLDKQKKKEERKKQLTMMHVCPFCKKQNEIGYKFCAFCGTKLNIYELPELEGENVDLEVQEVQENQEEHSDEEDFTGVYRYTFFGKEKEVYCPRCGSENCSHYQEQKIIPGKTKTQYTANLNPLHPFTLVNKKEKVVRKEQSYTDKMFICNRCGHTFH